MDVRRLKPAARLGFGDYAVIERVFTLPRPTRADALGVAAANLPIPPVWRTGNNRAVVAFPPVTPLSVALASLLVWRRGDVMRKHGVYIVALAAALLTGFASAPARAFNCGNLPGASFVVLPDGRTDVAVDVGSATALLFEVHSQNTQDARIRLGVVGQFGQVNIFADREIERGQTALVDMSVEMESSGGMDMGWRAWTVWQVRENLLAYHAGYSQRSQAEADFDERVADPGER